VTVKKKFFSFLEKDFGQDGVTGEGIEDGAQPDPSGSTGEINGEVLP